MIVTVTHPLKALRNLSFRAIVESLLPFLLNHNPKFIRFSETRVEGAIKVGPVGFEPSEAWRFLPQSPPLFSVFKVYVEEERYSKEGFSFLVFAPLFPTYG